MTREEFKNYEGKETFGKSQSGFVFSSGIVVGYSPDDRTLLARLANETGTTDAIFRVCFESEKEKVLYSKCNDNCGYSYLWCDIKNVKQYDIKRSV